MRIGKAILIAVGTIVVGLLVIAALAGAFGSAEPDGADGSRSSEPPRAAPSSTDATTEAVAFGDGTFVVGTDIDAGTYRAKEPEAGIGCYWERIKDFKGTLDSILANGNAAGGGPLVVTILPSDRGFSSEGCGDWTTDIDEPLTDRRTVVNDGIWIVGVDVAPGTYRIEPADGCYWARLRDFTGGVTSIIANDLPTSTAIVQIERSDSGFESANCGSWRRA